MAGSKNEVIGVVRCWGRDCEERASVHETKRGGVNRRGLLYLNCPSCKCLQPTSEASQRYIKRNLEPRAGFEHLCEAAPEPEQRTEKEPETSEPEPEKIMPPGRTSEKRGALVGAGLLAVAVAAAFGMK